jgi:hypothetical protein
VNSDQEFESLLKEHERQLDEEEKQKEERKKERAASKKAKEAAKQKTKRRKEEGAEGGGEGGEFQLQVLIPIYYLNKKLFSKNIKIIVKFANKAAKSFSVTPALAPTISSAMTKIWKNHRKGFGHVLIANKMDHRRRMKRQPIRHQAIWKHVGFARSAKNPNFHKNR